MYEESHLSGDVCGCFIDCRQIKSEVILRIQLTLWSYCNCGHIDESINFQIEDTEQIFKVFESYKD